MKKGTKSFGGFIVVTLSAILIIAAIVAAAFYNEVVIPEPETQALAAGEEYVHGSDIGRRPSGTAGTDYYNVSTYSDFRTRVNNNQNINLTSNITFENRSLRSTASYTGTIYGNGHTITFDFSQFPSSDGNAQDALYAGLLVGQLNGNIYDLKIVLTGGVIFKSGYHAENIVAGFGMVGYIKPNSTIDNVSITINSGAGIIAYTTDNSNQIALGLVAGYAENCTINNITINNNGTIAAGYFGNSNGSGTLSDLSVKDSQGGWTDNHVQPRSASHIVGGYYSGTVNLNNIIINGSGTVFGREATNLGCTWSETSTVSVTNFLNHFTGIFDGAGDESACFTKWHLNSSTNINTYFEYYDSDSATVSAKGAYNATFSEKLSFRTTGDYANMQILFDPSTSNYNNSLVVVYKNQTIEEGYIYLWSLGSNDNGSTFSGTEENGTVIFADLPVQSIWNNNDWGTGTYPRGDGYFEAHLSSERLNKEDDLTEYDHGYVPNGYTPSGSGTGLSSTELFDLFVNRNNSNHHNGKGEYYLEEDAVITGFTGRNFGGTLDGKGHTVYIVDAQTGLTGTKIGGLVGTLTGTIKNIRIVIASSVTLSTTGENPNSFGLVAGAVNGGTFENVNVVVGNNVTVTAGASNSGKTAALGGLAGCTVGTSTSGCTVRNCTVEINGTLSANGSYVFLAGFIGRSYNVTSTLYDYDNIILKGSGQFAGVANASTEPKCVAAVSVMCGSSGKTQLDLNGLIYNFTNETPVAGTYSCYGYFANNTYGTQMSQELSANNYIAYNNVYTFGCEMNEYWWDRDTNNPNSSSWNGNTYIHIPTTAAISGSVTNLDGSTVTPYFRPSSTTEYNAANITLVASASNWSGFELLKADGASTALSVDSGSDKVIDVAKTDAVSDRKITVIKFETVEIQFAAPNELSDLTYSGIGQDATANLVYQGGTYGAYSLSYTPNGGGASLSNGKPLTVGNYLVTITLKGDDFFYYNGAASKTYTGLGLRMNKALVPFGVSLGNASLTYTASEQTGDPSVIATSGGDKYDHLLNDLGTVTFTYTPSGGSSPLSGDPTNAGTYTVSFTYTNTANVGILNGAIATATLTITPKEVSLANTTVDKTFASADDAITSANVNLNGPYDPDGTLISGFITDDPSAVYSVSLALADGSAITDSNYIVDNVTGIKYLAAGNYDLTVTLSSTNYTFGTTSGENTDTVTVNVAQGANSVSTEYARDNWVYYNTPSAQNFQMRFGTPTFSYRNTTTEQVFDSMTSTSPVGTYNVTVTVAETTSYSTFEQTFSGVFEITALPVSITLTAQDADYSAKQYAESNITVSLGESYSATDVAAILGEITWNVTGENHTEPNVLPTNAGTYTLGIASVGNAANIDVDLTNVSDEFVISPRAVAFEAAEAENAALYYGQNISDFSGLVSVTHEDMTGYDFEKADWRYSVTSDFTTTTTANTPVKLTVKIFVDDPNYSVAEGDGEFVLNNIKVSKADIVIKVDISGREYDGTLLEATAEETSAVTDDPTGSDITLTYYSVNTAETGDGRYTELDSAPINAGTYAVRATVAGQDNYNAAATEYIEFTIQKAQMVIKVTMNGWIYNGNAGTAAVVSGQKENPVIDVTYIGTPNGGTTDEYNSPDVPKNAGSYRVVVSVEDTANYFGVPETVVRFTVERAALSDLRVSVEGWTYDATEHYLSSIPVAIENNNGNGVVKYEWVTVNDGQSVALDTNYIRNAGVYRVTAKVEETNNYDEGSNFCNFTVAKREVTVKADSNVIKYGVLTPDNAGYATNYALTFDGFYGTEADGSFKLSLGYSDQVTDGFVNAGEYDLTVTLINTNYTFKTADGTLSGTATIPVVVSKYTENTWTEEGEYSNPGWTYYTYPENTIKNAEAATAAKFGAPTFAYEVMGADGSWTAYSGDWANATPAGTYRVTVTVADTNNYNGLSGEYQFVVAKRDVTFNISSDITTVYGADYKVTFTVGNDGGLGSSIVGAVTYEFRAQNAEETPKWTEGLPAEAGIFDVRVKSWGNSANVNLVGDTALVVTINRREVEFTVSLEEGAEIVYGMTLQEVRDLVSISTDTELVYGSEIGVKVGDTDYTGEVNADTSVSITVEITVNDPNYTAKVIGDKEYALTVQKRAVTIAVDETATMLHANYNQFDPTPFYGHIRIDGLLNGDVKENVFNITLPVVSDTPTTDTYEVNVSLNTDFEGYDNYEFGETTEWGIKLTLSAREFTFTVTMPESFVYGKEIDGMEIEVVQPEGEEEIPSSVLHQPMTFRYIGVEGTEYDSDIAPVNVGKYRLTVTITGTADYHSEPATSNVFEITPAPLTMTINAAAGGLSTTYDPNTEEITDFMAAFAGYFTVAFPADGAYTDEFGDIFSLSATKDNDGAVKSIKNAGAYTLTPTLENKNYSITDIPSLTYTVNKANMSVTVSVANWAYGEYSSKLNAPSINGIMEDADLLEGYSVVYTLTSDESDTPIENIAAEDVGNYTVTVTVPATDNYNGTTVEATFDITKTKFTSSVTITGWTYGKYNAELNAPSVTENPGNAAITFTYTGRDGTEYAESERVPVNAGYYTVTAYIDGSVNYEALEVSCNFAIDKASVSPAIDAELSKTYDGDAVAFTLTEGSNPGMGEVTYVIEREISGEYVAVTEARYSGNYRVRATVSETANYSGATTEPVTFAIGQKAVTASWSVADAALVYGDGYDEALALIDIDKEAVLAQFAAGDGEYVEFLLAATVADGSDYSELVNAGTAVTFGLSIAFADGTAQDIVGSYSISVTGAGSKTVTARSIEIAATDTSDIYGSSFTADGSLAEYFAENFTYNGTSVNAIADEYTTVAFAVNGTSGAAIPNAGTYTVTVTVGGNYTGAASAAYTIEQKTLTVAAGYELPFGVLNAENIAEYAYEALLGGFVGDESVDYTVRADDELGDEDSSFGFLNVREYVLTVEIAENTNYTFETGYTAKFTVNIEKTDNAWIVEYARGDWTYLSEPAAVTSPEARFAESDIDVRYYADSGYTVEMAPEAFTAATPAGTYYVTVSVPGSDNFNALRAEYSFEIYRLRAEMEVSTPEAVYDGEPYDGLTYTVSGAAADVVGEIGWMYIGEGMRDYVPGLPVDAGSYAVRIASVENLSIDIINITETFALVIDPATVNFTVRIASGMSVTYGDEITNAAAFVNTPVPEIDVGEFTYTVTAYNSRGALYTSGLQAGEQVSFAVEVTIEDTNYVANVRSTPSLTVRRLALEPEIVVGDETVTHGDEISVSNGSEFLVIDAITRYMADNGVRYYEYAIYVNGARYTTDYAFTPGEYEISVAIDGNFSGELRLTVNVDGNPELSVASSEPETAIGRFLDSINLSVAGAVAILLGFMVSLVVCLLIGLRKRGSE